MMRAQGQTTVVGGESYMGQSSRWRSNDNNNGKMSSSRYCCKRTKRALEPVLEHCELAMYDTSNTTTNDNMKKSNEAAPVAACEAVLYSNCPSGARKPAGGGLRILSRLRDGYVKLMNDVALGANLPGVSSFCGAPGYGLAPRGVAVEYRSAVKVAPLSPRRFVSPGQP